MYMYVWAHCQSYCNHLCSIGCLFYSLNDVLWWIKGFNFNIIIYFINFFYFWLELWSPFYIFLQIYFVVLFIFRFWIHLELNYVVMLNRGYNIYACMYVYPFCLVSFIEKKHTVIFPIHCIVTFAFNLMYGSCFGLHSIWQYMYLC